MKINILINLPIFVLLIQQCCAKYVVKVVKNSQYSAVAVEYASLFNPLVNGSQNVENNVGEYVRIIDAAMKEFKANIFVFPECGLTSVYMPHDAVNILPYTSVVPDPKDGIVPCDYAKQDHLTRLSCQARTSGVYLVVNTAEKYRENDSDDWLFYNTNVVFDRKGAVIARYRKYNLYNQEGFNKTAKPEYVTFTTDFGVTFGTFTCFDILFAEPALTLVRDYNVTNFVFATAWFSELPFLTANQVQTGWAKANNVNFIASGYDDIKIGAGGSSIYSSQNELVKFILPYFVETEILTLNIPSNNDKKIIARTELHRPIDQMVLKKENLTLYSIEFLKYGQGVYNLCYKDFCCNFNVSINSVNTPNYVYAAVAYGGNRTFGFSQVETVQICGIIACLTQDRNTCGELAQDDNHPTIFQYINIYSSSFSGNKTFNHFPTAVISDLSPLNPATYDYSTVPQANGSKVIEMKTRRDVAKLLAFGIYGVQ